MQLKKPYVNWVVQFIRFHKMKHPDELGEQDIEAFLNHLVLQRNCSKSTQRTALNALIFLFKNI
ncbi:MAG: site-specific integrase [Enterobacterales bacterium]|nr:site-specific integrase [Enterobacterales bacterium]